MFGSRKVIKIIALSLFLALLGGCSRTVVYYTDSPPDPDLGQIHDLQRELVSRGVKVLDGQNSLTLVLPATIFFQGNSANFTDRAYRNLDVIVNLLFYYEKATVKVTGYIDGYNYSLHNKAIAETRAQRVASYLWKQGIDASFIYAEGVAAHTINQCRQIPIASGVIVTFHKLSKNRINKFGYVRYPGP